MSGQFVTANYFSVLGVNPVTGRTFTAGNETEPVVAVISYRFWQRNYGGDPSVIGKPLVVSGKPLTIVGVAPPDFLGLEAGSPTDVTLLLAAQSSILPEFGNRLAMRSGWWNLTIMGRLKAGVSVEQARAELDVLLQQWNVAENVPELSIQRSFARVGLQSGSKGLDALRRRFSKPLLLVAFISSGPAPVDLQVQPDLRILGFTTAISMLTGILVGLMPALRGSTIDLTPALKENAAALDTSHRVRWSFGQSLVAGNWHYPSAC